ncbi:MAG: SDR family NAD(P)-dependent oxidoreductase [Solirubrobacterales bacterium]|nr:SDR family NAD(P)-dependent oxidoreductase [Solirubrobacterales bacterium]
MTRVDGQVLITGATGGLGHSIARGFAAAGAQLTLSGRRVEVLEPLAAQLSARTIAADLSSRAEVAALAERAGAVDVLVANAALPATGRIFKLDQREIDTLLEVNLRSQIALARALLPGMLERGSGHLVFVSSLAGKAASPGASLYNATKFGLRGFALAIREDLRGSGVSASVVLPGFVADAGMFHDSGAKLPPGVGLAKPEQVANAVLKAVRRDRAELAVAPLGLRIATEIGALAPGISGRFQALAGGNGLADAMTAGQADKRPL